MMTKNSPTIGSNGHLDIIDTKAPDIFGGPYHPYYTYGKPNWFKDQYLIQTLGQAPMGRR